MFWNTLFFKIIKTAARIISWHFFLLIFATIVIDDLASLLLTDSKMFGFYAALYAFEPLTLSLYIFNLIQILLNLLILIPCIFYIYNEKITNKTWWMQIFFAKLFFDISGHYYHFLEWKSLFYIAPSVGIFNIILLIILWSPSYIAPIKFLTGCPNTRH